MNVRDDRLVHHSTYLDVPAEWLGEQFIIEAEELKKHNEMAYRNEYLGEPTGTGGAIFTNLTIREISDDEIRKFDKISDGIDFGFAIDPAVYTQNHLDKTHKRLFIFNEIYQINCSNKKLWEMILMKKISQSYITADSAEPKSIAEMNGYGSIRILGAKKGADSVEYGIKWLQDLYEIVIDPRRCPNTAREFKNYEYERDKYGNFISKFPDANNHTIDATRYSRESDMKKVKWEVSNSVIVKSFILVTDESENYIESLLRSILPLQDDEELIIFDNLSRDNTVPFIVKEMGILWIDKQGRYKFYINKKKENIEIVKNKALSVAKGIPILINTEETFNIEEVRKCYD